MKAIDVDFTSGVVLPAAVIALQKDLFESTKLDLTSVDEDLIRVRVNFISKLFYSFH